MRRGLHGDARNWQSVLDVCPGLLLPGCQVTTHSLQLDPLLFAPRDHRGPEHHHGVRRGDGRLHHQRHGRGGHHAVSGQRQPRLPDVGHGRRPRVVLLRGALPAAPQAVHGEHGQLADLHQRQPHVAPLVRPPHRVRDPSGQDARQPRALRPSLLGLQLCHRHGRLRPQPRLDDAGAGDEPPHAHGGGGVQGGGDDVPGCCHVRQQDEPHVHGGRHHPHILLLLLLVPQVAPHTIRDEPQGEGRGRQGQVGTTASTKQK
mmetsp:Transcript_9149/g.21347  ORF Transcript_9149/g.21347 Transcript_9149/m.21347 type:complete len:259 (+) Transcript_9149:342-1118(+)